MLWNYMLHVHGVHELCSFLRPALQCAFGTVHLLKSDQMSEHRVAWPSGLRRWFKAPVSSEAWVRIPPLPRNFRSNCRQEASCDSLATHDGNHRDSIELSRSFTTFGLPSFGCMFEAASRARSAYAFGSSSLYELHPLLCYKVVWPSGLRRWF